MFLALMAFAAPQQATLAAVGDINLARWVGRRIQKSGNSVVLAGVRASLRNADVCYGNLECALTKRPATVPHEVVLHAQPSTVGALRGFDVLSLVNNHSADCGPAGVSDAVTLLHGVGIQTLAPYTQGVVVVRHGVRIGFVGEIDLPGFPLSENMEHQIQALRERCDVVVVAVHWGVEMVAKPSPRQVSLAGRLANLGADVVVGSHPHVIQPVSTIDGVAGRRCLVAYSLGNFVFDARPGPSSDSEILYVRLGRLGVTAYATRRCRIIRNYPIASSDRLAWHRV